MYKKRLLVMGDYFYPDVASTGQLLTELCLELQNDYDITVVTSVPLFKQEEYKLLINHEMLQNINIIRIKTKPFDKQNKISRGIHILEYYHLVKKAIKQIGKQDIIFSISQPPILGGKLGLYAKRVHKAKFIYNIQDFNPEQIEAVGYSRNSLLIGLLRALDISTCRKADKIVIVGGDMRETLKRRNICVDDKVLLINNWIDEKEIYPLSGHVKIDEFKRRYGLLGKFIFMYSGNIGLYYDLENIIEVIGRFNGRDDVIFAFIGDGAKKQFMERYVKDNNINNVVFIPYQSKDDIVFSLNAADVHLVTNLKGIKGVSVPSKIYGVMAVGKYVLGILEKGSEAAELIKKSGCGQVVEPGDYEGIYRAMENILNSDRDKVKDIGLKGRFYLESNLKKDIAIDSYRKLFTSI